MRSTSPTSSALAAFCQQCPDEPTVRVRLAALGFALTFQMAGSPATDDVPVSPAQYHYHDRYGTEVLYLAGRDIPLEEGVHYPAHRSRFWVYAGASPHAYQQAIASVTAGWFMAWFPVREPHSNRQSQSA